MKDRGLTRGFGQDDLFLSFLLFKCGNKLQESLI